MDCIFCKIVNGEIPGEKVYEDEEVVGIMDINPANKGHALVLPREHYETYTDLPDELAGKIAKVTKKVANGVLKATGVEGYNILNNNHKVAGQLVGHVHFHVIPRYENDGIKIDMPTKEYEDNELSDYAQKIKDSMES